MQEEFHTFGAYKKKLEFRTFLGLCEKDLRKGTVKTEGGLDTLDEIIRWITAGYSVADLGITFFVSFGNDLIIRTRISYHN